MPSFDPLHRQMSLPARGAAGLHRVGLAIGHLLRARGEAAGLSPAQIQALLFLRYARPGVRTIGGLAKRLGASAATASGVVDALEAKGLVERRAGPEDRRSVSLRLTPTGRASAARLDDVIDEVEDAVASLPPGEQQALVGSLEAIVRRLQAAGLVQVFEMCPTCQFFRPNAHPDDRRGPHHCAFVDAPLSAANIKFECPDYVPQPAAPAAAG